MAQLNILEYARHFDLTKDYTDNDINDQILTFYSKHHVCQQLMLDRSISDLDPKLLEIFERATRKYFSPFDDDELLPLAETIDDHFQFCKPLPDSTRFQIFQTQTQAYRCRQNTKLPLPLLKIGGGNVEKDVKKIRRGIDLDRALQEIVEDHQDDRILEDKEVLAEKNVQEQALDFVQQQFDRKSLLESCEITVSCLRFLKEAVTDPLADHQVGSAVIDTLPPRLTRPISWNQHISEEDFELHAQDRLPHKSLDPAASRPDRNADSINSEPPFSSVSIFGINNILNITPQLDTINLSALNFREEFVHATCLDDWGNCKDGSELSSRHKSPRDISHLPIQDSADTAEPIASVLDEQNNELEQPISKGSSSPTRLYATSRTKIPLPNVNVNCFELPVLDDDRLLTYTAEVKEIAGGACLDLTSFRANLPFKIPDLKDAIYDEKPFTSVLLERCLTRPSHITSSSDMLYKDPGVRVLDKTSEDEEDLELEDYLTEEQFGSMPQITLAEQSGEPKSNPVCESDDDHMRHSATATFPPSSRLDSPAPSGTISTPNDGRPKQHGHNFHAISKKSLKPCTLFQSAARSPDNHQTVLGKRKREVDLGIVNDEKLNSNTRLHGDAAPRLDGSNVSAGTAGCHDFQSDSLFSFLDLRGKKFQKPVTTRSGKAAELSDDPIQCTQSEQCITGSKMNSSDIHHNIKLAPPNLPLPECSSLGQLRTIVVNNSLLQRKQMLIRYLEQTDPQMLCLLYRDLDMQQLGGADIILNASTCLLITNIQALDQRSLPGQKSDTGLSKTHDSIVKLAHTHSHVIVLVHYLHSTDVSVQPRLISTLTEFLSFCRKCSISRGQVRGAVSPIWLPCETVASTADVVNAWVWQLIRNHGHRNDDIQQSGVGALLQEETLWELFLRAAGINPLAAQLMLSLLRNTSEGPRPEQESDVPWGVRRLISISSAQKSSLFGQILNKETINELNRLLQQSTA